MNNFESFRTERDLLRRIEQLREAGIKDSEMHVISANNLTSTDLDYVDVTVDSGNVEPTFGDKVTAFFTGESPEEVAFDRFHFDDDVRYEVSNSIRNGNYILVIDKEGYYDDELYFSGRNEFVDEDLRNNPDLTDDERIRLHEERLRVSKDRVQAGEVNINKDVVTEHQEVEVPLEKERVTIERRKVDERAAGDFDTVVDEEGTIRVPITEERANIQKENVVAEEIVIKKDKVTETETVGADLRKERVEIDKDVDVVDRDRDVDVANRNVDVADEDFKNR